jgi:hypothetical protein
LIEDGGDGVREIGGAVEAGDVGGNFWRRSHWERSCAGRKMSPEKG